MKKALLSALLLLPLVAFAQSKQSNKLYNKGVELFKAENYEEALPYFQKSDSLDKAELQPTAENYYRAELKVADCWHQIASNRYDEGNYAEAIKLETIVMEIRKKALGEEHHDYASSLSNLALYNSDNGNYTEAFRLENIAMEIFKKTFGEEHPDYASSLDNLAYYYSGIGNDTEAIRLATIAMEIRKKVLGEEHIDYATSLCNIASYYFYIGKYTEAIRIGTIAAEIYKNTVGEETPDYANSINNLACYYDNIGNYAEAIRLGTLAMEIWKKTLGEEHPNYATSLNNLVGDYYAIGNYTEAIRIGTIAAEIVKKVLGEEHPDYAFSLNNLAFCYSIIGNNTEAIKLGTIAMEIRKKVWGEEHPGYATTLDNLAAYNSEIGNYTEAIRLSTIAMEIRKKVLGEEHPDYANSLNNLASHYSDIGNHTEAVKLGTIAMEIYEKALGKEHPLYAISLNNLAGYYSRIGNYTEAVRLETIALGIRKKVLGAEHPDYAKSLDNLADGYFAIGKYDDAEHFYKQSYKCKSSFILKYFSSMTTNERTTYWNMYSVFFSNKLTEVAYKLSSADTSYYGAATQNDINALAYDGQLFSKGLLLNAELEIQKLIEQSGDTAFANRYYKIRQDRVMLDNLYQLAPDEREMDADSLSKVIENEERLLVESSKELGDYTKNLSVSWQDVQRKLKDNDVAIEFAAINDTAARQQVYIALVLKKAMTAPELVKLFTSKELVDIYLSDYYTTTKVTNLVWDPLQKYFNGVENVYFAPAGELHTIGIEYLPTNDGSIFSTKYNVFRLSSTRELALSKTKNQDFLASVYGGVVYDFSKTDWNNLLSYKDDLVARFRDMPDLSGESMRAELSFLPGAKVEAENVAEILHNGKYQVSEWSDVFATEESFKRLSGSGISILHIATHGFYEPERKKSKQQNQYTDNASREDRSLSRSGLFLAGAASALNPEKSKDIPDGVDDGILTAKEISRLDFKGLDLVVLSACQTGLGDVTSDGVFGLQRGFKKAGAQTIVMSLWNVSDEATKDLMTEFYKNLVAGQTKRGAFVAAQEKLRQTYPDPKKWAAFIMVDGLEN